MNNSLKPQTRRDSILITAERLHELLDGANRPVVLDVRWELPTNLEPFDGKPQYLQGHIPGAVYLDLDTELAETPSVELGRHPLPSQERLTRALERCGVRPDRLVVAYDAIGGLGAARAWWLLKDCGFNVRLLDGGLQAWQDAGFDLETEDIKPHATKLNLNPGQMAILHQDEIPNFVENGILLDARGGVRYRGESEPLDSRPGHIPGARSAPAGHDLDPLRRFLSDEVLKARFARHGISPTGPKVAVYCGSGITASHEIAALAILGVDAALYPGSYSQWSGDPNREIETGPYLKEDFQI